MLKVLTLLTRKPGLSREEFIRYYEERHAVLGLELMGKNVRRYVRRYIVPETGVFAHPGNVPSFDVITEAWFDDRAAYDETIAGMRDPDRLAALSADEEFLFDRDKHMTVFVEEHESDIPSR